MGKESGSRPRPAPQPCRVRRCWKTAGSRHSSATPLAWCSTTTSSPAFFEDATRLNPMIRFECPACRAVIAATDYQAAAKGPCPRCGKRVKVPPPKSAVLGQPLEEDPAQRQVLRPPPDVQLPPQGIHRQRIAIAATAGAGMLATFLPWVH